MQGQQGLLQDLNPLQPSSLVQQRLLSHGISAQLSARFCGISDLVLVPRRKWRHMACTVDEHLSQDATAHPHLFKCTTRPSLIPFLSNEAENVPSRTSCDLHIPLRFSNKRVEASACCSAVKAKCILCFHSRDGCLRGSALAARTCATAR